MALVRWEPLTELEQMRRRMERVFGRMMPRITWAPREEVPMFMPEVDVYETDGEVVMKAELPGIEPQDLAVEVSADSVTISGECRHEEEVREEGMFLSERSYGRFSRTVGLPEKIKEAEARATFKNGVLTVRAPLSEEERMRRRKVPVEALGPEAAP